MNTPSSPVADPIEVAFVFDGSRIQARGMLTQAQYDAIDGLRSDRPQGLSLMPLPENSESNDAHSAEHLVETITDAIGGRAAQKSKWKKVMELARRIDAIADTCPSPSGLLVEFVWENGGGDDNLFGQAFAADVAGPENEALVGEFTEALKNAGEDDFYDMDLSAMRQGREYMDINELIEFLDENEGMDDGLDALREALQAGPESKPRGVGIR